MPDVLTIVHRIRNDSGGRQALVRFHSDRVRSLKEQILWEVCPAHVESHLQVLEAIHQKLSS